MNGNANDESGNGNNGVVYRSILVEDIFGVPNSAYSFDRIDYYMSIGKLDGFSTLINLFSWSIWIKATVKAHKIMLQKCFSPLQMEGVDNH